MKNNNSQQPEVIACQGEGENSSVVAPVKPGSEFVGVDSDNPSADINNQNEIKYN